MTTPAALADDQVVWIYGRYAYLNGAPMTDAKVSVKPNVAALVNLATDTIISHQSFMTTTDTDGFFSLSIPAADATQIDPQGFTYTVYEPTYRVYELSVTLADTEVKVDGPLVGKKAIDLVDAVPVDTPVGGTALLLRGDPGRGVLTTSVQDDHLFITYTDGTTENAGPVNPEANFGMGNLVNVQENADTSVPSVLVRGTDGIYRSVPTTMFVTQGRASYITYVDGVPTDIPPDAQPGDYFTVINGDNRGEVYQVEDI